MRFLTEVGKDGEGYWVFAVAIFWQNLVKRFFSSQF
jgi:hypothetical protein